MERPWESPEFYNWLKDLARRVKRELKGQRGVLVASLEGGTVLLIEDTARHYAAGTPLARKLESYDPATQVIILFRVGDKDYEYTLKGEVGKTSTGCSGLPSSVGVKNSSPGP